MPWSRSLWLRYVRFSMLVISAALLQRVGATPPTWAGNSSDDINDITKWLNWTGSLAPGLSDSVVISTGSAHIGNNKTFGSLTFSGGTIAGTATLTLGTTANSNWTSGSFSFTGGGVNVQSSATLNISSTSDHHFDATALSNGGTIAWSGGNLLSGNGGSITNSSGATFADQTASGTNYIWDAHGGSLSFTNNGSYNKTGGGTTELRSSFNNSGSVSVQSGTLRFTENTTHGSSANFSVGSGANVEMSGGTHALGNGASLTGAGQYKINGGTLSVGSGSATVSNLALTSGALSGSGTVSVGTLTSSGGTMDIAGLTLTGTGSSWTGNDWSSASASQATIASGATFAISSSDHYFDRRTLTNNGTTTWSGGHLRSGNGTAIANNATWNDTNAGNVSADNYYGGTAWTFTNGSGASYNKSGAGTTTFSVPFANQGNVSVTNGTLALAGGSTVASGSTFNVGSGAILRFNGGTHSVANGASLGGAGTYVLTTGTLDVAGSLTIGTLNQTGGKLSGSNTLQGGSFNWSGGDWNTATSQSTTIASGATLNLDTANTHDFERRAVTSSGTVHWSGNHIRSGNGGSFTNDTGATFDDEATSGTNYVYAYYGGAFTFTNNGTYHKSGASATQFDTTFNNNATVNVASGLLKINGGGANSGSGVFNTSAGAETQFSSNYAIANGSSLTGAGTYSLTNGTLSVAGDITVSAFNQNGGVLGGSHRFASGTFNWNSGNWNGSAGDTTTVGSAATLNLDSGSAHDFERRAVTNDGTVHWSGNHLRSGNGGSFTNSNGATFNDEGTSGTNYIYAYYGGAFTFTNNGTYAKSGAGTTQVDTTFNNNATINVANGKLKLNGGGTNSGSGVFNTSAGAEIQFTNDYAIANGSALTGAGLYSLAGGTLSVGGDIAVSTFTQTAGVLGGTHRFTSGTINWDAGSWNAASTGISTTIAGGATLNLGTASAHDFERRAVTNEGTVHWAGNHIRSGNGGTFTNATSATFDDEGTSGTNYIYSYYGGAFTFTNNGTYHKSGAATTQFDTTFNNNAAVNVAAGVLKINGGGTSSSSGIFNTAAGAQTQFTANYTLANGASLTGAGLYSLSGGTLSITGDVLVATFNQIGGSLGGSHRFTGGTFNWNAGDWNSATTGITTTVASGATINLGSGSAHDFERRSVTNEGTMNWSGNHIRSGNGGSLTNAAGATMNDTATSGTNYITSYYGGAFTVTNNGTYHKSGAATTQVDTTFNNNATVNVVAGTLKLNGGGTNAGSGVFNTAAGATTQFSADYNVGHGSAFSGLGNYMLTGGRLTVSGDVNVTNFHQSGGIWAGTNRLLGGNFNWAAGDWNASAGETTTIANTAILTFASGNDHDFERRGVINDGVINWTGNSLRSGNGGSLNNHAGGIFNDQNASGTSYISAYYGGGFTFTNAGTYAKSGLGNSEIQVPFTNTGNVIVSAGLLHFTNAFTHSSGNMVLVGNASVVFDQNPHFASGYLMGSGTVTANAVTVGGFIAPGSTTGLLAITGDLTLLNTSMLLIDLGGTNQGSNYDLLSVGGNAALAGTLSLTFTNGFQSTITSSNVFTVMTVGGSGGLTGAFSNVANGQRLITADGIGSFLVNYGGGLNAITLSSFQPVPEPSTYALLGAGLAVMALVHRRRRR